MNDLDAVHPQGNPTSLTCRHCKGPRDGNGYAIAKHNSP